MLKTDSAYYPYRGLPCDIVESIIWKNNGNNNSERGTNIVIEYTNGKIIGYEYILYPLPYLKTISTQKNLHRIKQEICTVYIKTLHFESMEYLEIWNNKDEKFENIYPHESYEDLINTGNLLPKPQFLLDFFLSNINFARLLLSIHYPFKYYQVLDYWDYIAHGEAFYSCCRLEEPVYNAFYIIHSPKFGLCFNENILWNEKLKGKFEYGIIYNVEKNYNNEDLWGLIDTVHGLERKEDATISRRKNNNDIIPLNIEKEISYFNDACKEEHLIGTPHLTYLFDKPFLISSEDMELLNKKYSYLPIDQIEKLYNQNKVALLLNRSIWEKTFKNSINEEFVHLVFFKVRYLQNCTDHDFEDNYEYKLDHLRRYPSHYYQEDFYY